MHRSRTLAYLQAFLIAPGSDSILYFLLVSRRAWVSGRRLACVWFRSLTLRARFSFVFVRSLTLAARICRVVARSLTLAVLIALCSVLGGCPATPLRASNHASNSIERVTIRYSIWGSFEEWQMWNEIVAAFERKYSFGSAQDRPRIKVKLEYYPQTEAYEQKAKILLAAGREADVMEMQDEPFQMYCTKDKFEDLTPYLRRAGEAYSAHKFLPTSLEVFRFNRTGKQMGLPWDGGGIIVYYNRAVFRKAGVDYPHNDWTWQDFVRICKRLTKDVDGDGRIDRFGYELQPWWGYQEIFIWGAGGKYFDAENTTIGGMTRAAPLHCTLDDKNVAAGLQFYQNLRHKHRVAPLSSESSGRNEDVLFLTGHIAMRFNGPWGMPLLRQAKGVDWDVAPIPIAPIGRRVTRCSWDGVAMSKASRHKLEAWKLIEFITGEEGQTIIARSRRGVPARESVARSEAFIDPGTPQHEEYFVEAVNYQRIQPITEIWTEMDPIMQRENDKLLLGKQDGATTARTLAHDLNRLLRQKGLGG